MISVPLEARVLPVRLQVQVLLKKWRSLLHLELTGLDISVSLKMIASECDSSEKFSSFF
ncbi:hypothetical protein [Scytonema sp. NUACC21]